MAGVSFPRYPGEGGKEKIFWAPGEHATVKTSAVLANVVYRAPSHDGGPARDDTALTRGGSSLATNTI